MFLKILLLLSIITTLHCNTIDPDPFIQLETYSKYFKVVQLIKNQSILSQNETFNTTREKYYYIYFPLFVKCLEQIGEDFQPLLNSVTPTSIGAAGYGIAAGLKVALKVGLWKTGFFGLLKASTATLFSASVLPIAVGVGTLAYMYNKYEQNEIKQKCSQSINLFEKIINMQQLDFLLKVKATVYQQLMESSTNLSQINEKQKSIKSTLRKYQEAINNLEPKIKMYQSFFKTFKRLTNQ